MPHTQTVLGETSLRGSTVHMYMYMASLSCRECYVEGFSVTAVFG